MKAYIAVTAHFDQDGIPFSMLLDLVEVAQSHSGLNLATAFAKVLDDFGISDKVSLNFCFSFGDSLFCRYSASLVTMPHQTIQWLTSFPTSWMTFSWCTKSYSVLYTHP